MALFAKPAGALRVGRLLNRPPKIICLRAGAPAKILFLTDLHLRRAHPENADTVLSCCACLKPEIVLLGGDESEYDEGLTLFLQKLTAAFPHAGIFAVPGNNDDALLDGDRARQKEVYASFGIDYLLNEVRRIEMPGGVIELAGLEDAYTHTPDVRGLFSDEADVYRIVLAHEPLKSSVSPRADLMLTGHTHGGQINVLGLTCYALVGYERSFKYACLAGEKRIGKTRLIVSRGFGYSKFPIRLGARSEVHYIE